MFGESTVIYISPLGLYFSHNVLPVYHVPPPAAKLVCACVVVKVILIPVTSWFCIQVSVFIFSCIVLVHVLNKLRTLSKYYQ